MRHDCCEGPMPGLSYGRHMAEAVMRAQLSDVGSGPVRRVRGSVEEGMREGNRVHAKENPRRWMIFILLSQFEIAKVLKEFHCVDQ